MASVLAEMVRQAERVLDLQLRLIAEQDDKSEHMLRLGVAALAGGVALAAFGSTQPAGPLAVAYAAWLGAGGACNFAALLFFVHGYVGIGRGSRKIMMGPSLVALARESRRPAMDLRQLRQSFLASAPGYARAHARLLQAASRSTTRGLYLLVLGVLLYGLAFTFIVGRLLI